jgi:hypothetical protein
MIRKFKNIISILLLSVFLLPTVVKFEHHHRHNESYPKNEKHSLVLQDNCPICNFDFSIFLTSIDDIDFQKENHFDNYINNYDSRYNSDFLQFSFSLRAPPLNIHN